MADTPHLVRSNPAVRSEDYARALDFYAHSLSPARWRILFVENSGYSLSRFQEIARTRGHELATVGYRSELDIRAKGKGAAEAEILDRALEHIHTDLPETRQVTKVTGRLLVRNITRLVPLMDIPHLGCRVHRDHSMVDTRVMDFDVGTWADFLTGLGELVDESQGRFLEHAVALRLAEALYGGPTRWVELARELDVAGVSGSDGIPYDTVRSRTTRYLKDLLRVIPGGEYR